MTQEYEINSQHFAALKEKYQASNYENTSPDSPLYFILRKADLGLELSDLEYIWLQKEQLLNTANFIRVEQKQKSKERIKLGVEFNSLKYKYQVNNYNIDWAISPLYFILIRINAGDFLTEKESNWLIAHGFSKINIFAVETRKFLNLKSKYKASEYRNSDLDSELYSILKKIDVAERLTEVEYKWLQENQLLETLGFVKQQEAERRNEFTSLKERYQATKYKSKSVGSQLYQILKKLASQESLIDTEIAWLKEQELTETIAIAEEEEKTRDFADLKIKYQATDFEDTSPKSHLYKILKKVDSGNYLGEQDVNYLKKRKLLDTVKIVNDKYADFLKSKIGSLDFFTDDNIQWLENNGYDDIVKTAKEKYSDKLKSKVESFKLLNDAEIEWLKLNDYQDIIILMTEKHFELLKSKYGVREYKDNSLQNPLCDILQKLEKGERIEPQDVVWLQENNFFYAKIFVQYNIIEANFYQQEFKRTGNRWNLVNASSHLRKAEKSNLALQLTDDLPLNKISDNKLKSALLTTRGGAFRDIDNLESAENCARQAMKFQPDSHHPYTLMGAICFERYQYSDGEYWFNEAIKRGAKPLDMDSEMKSIVKKIKDEKQRQELVNYLLNKDEKRYNWAKKYLKKQKDKINNK
ncbi:MAG: hypothetical protein EAZ87_01615 [Nostocales cyanobacterium]|nr:MAG: hypothetical protein EAZ87_01615 [Nostocales cyanobacterium]